MSKEAAIVLLWMVKFLHTEAFGAQRSRQEVANALTEWKKNVNLDIFVSHGKKTHPFTHK